MIVIDGSFGEGGGQILRTALSLSLITGKPFRLEDIRANRDPPGLKRQHLAAVLAAAEVGSAKVEGAALKSRLLEFHPGKPRAGEYVFDVGSAGSTTLVFQTVLPPLMLADGPSKLVLRGGTHNFGAPPYDFLEQAFLPIVRRMGLGIETNLNRMGFAPAGGGEWTAIITPPRSLLPQQIMERGAILKRLARARVAAVPLHVAQRELAVVKDELKWADDERIVEELPIEWGPGNILTIEIRSEHANEVITGFGRRGVRAETVAAEAAAEARRYLNAGVPVGEHLADQLLLPFALAGGGSFRTLPLSMHSTTNMNVIAMFLDVRFEMTDAGTVTVNVRSR
jgi:RNA 3'-terminal phosphate cyclase (ATP)